MSGLRALLAVVSDRESGKAPLSAAIAIAKARGCHAEVLHVMPDPASVVPLVGEGMSGAVIDELMRAAESEGRQRAEGAHAFYQEQCTAHKLVQVGGPPGHDGPSVSWKQMSGLEDEIVALRSRVADLVVMGQPRSEREAPSYLTLNAALMEGGRPVLMVPHEIREAPGRTVLIAWNGSAEAARSVHYALPFLIDARKVVVHVAEEEEVGGPADCHALQQHLAWHGVEVSLHHAEGSDIGHRLLVKAAEIDADLLVMGAYTHSRLRQLVMGGVTSHVVEHATLPVLLSH